MSIQLYTDRVNPQRGRLFQRLSLTEDFVRAEGMHLFDREGHPYLDMTASYGALPFGHNPPSLVSTLTDHLRAHGLNLCKGSPNPLEARAADALCKAFGADRVLFTTSGAEAVNLAVKSARTLTGRRILVAFQGSYHGTTGEALSATGSERLHQAFSTSLDPDTVLCRYGDPGEISALVDSLHDCPGGGGGVAAIVVEPILGEGGVVLPPEGFLRTLRSLCDDLGCLLVVDEIQTGLGRTGHLSVALEAGVRPDLLLLSKGLGGGLMPLGACLFHGVWDRRLGDLHGSTFGGYGLGSVLVPPVLALLDEDFLAGVRARGRWMLERLKELARRYPKLIRDARGQGLLIGLELAEPTDLGSLFLNRMVEMHGLLPAAVAHARQRNRVCFATTLNSRRTLRITPPLIAREEDLDRALVALDGFFSDLASGRGAPVVSFLQVEASDLDLEQHIEDRLDAAETVEGSGQGRTSAALGAVVSPTRPLVVFLVHPGSSDYLLDFDPSFGELTAEARDCLAQRLAALLDPVRWQEFEVRGQPVEIVASPLLAEHLPRLRRRTWTREVEGMVRWARDRGARLVGLGALLSVATRDGLAIEVPGVGVTTGNSLTAWAAFEALHELAGQHLGNGHLPRVAVLGGYGNIGRCLAELLVEEGMETVLLGNPENPMRLSLLERAAREIAARTGTNGKVLPAASLEECARSVDILVTATNSASLQVDLRCLSPKGLVLDLAVPFNVREEQIPPEGGPRVYRVGRTTCPVEIPDLGMINLSDSLYGCLAETIVLGLLGDYSGYSKGDLEVDRVRKIGQMAKDQGFLTTWEPVTAKQGNTPARSGRGREQGLEAKAVSAVQEA